MTSPAASVDVSPVTDATPGSELLTIDKASTVLGELLPNCTLAALAADEAPTDEPTLANAPLVDDLMDALSFGPDIASTTYACTTGAAIIDIAIFDSAASRAAGFEYLGSVTRPFLAQIGVTQIALAWNDDDDWIAWSEKVDQPMPAPSTNVTMALVEVADALGGTLHTLDV